MARKVNEEMSDVQRRDELIMGLSATGAESVFVNISHLAQATNMVVAEELAESLVQTNEAVRPNLSARSTLRPKVQRSGMCQVDRVATLEACLKAKQDSNKKAIDAKLPVPKT